jgi:RNA polymerase sigma factor (sigma-70 family)
VAPEELTRQREAVLFRRAATGDRRAHDELVAMCLPAIGSMARRYRGASTIAPEEFIQAGVLGLLRALARFDPSRGTPFWAYASWWARQAMQQLVAEIAYPVVLSDRAFRDLAQLRRAQEVRGRDASAAQLADDCELPEAHVAQLLAVSRTPGQAAAMCRDDEEFERVERRLAGHQLRDLPGDLRERERDVLRARFGLGRPRRTLDEIATELGISGERVRQIETRALDKVRTAALFSAAAPHAS